MQLAEEIWGKAALTDSIPKDAEVCDVLVGQINPPH